MEETKCPFCKEDIKEGAIKCKHCRSALVDVSSMTNQVIKKQEGTLWLPIPSLVLGIIGCLAMLDDSYWTYDELVGAIFFTLVGIILGAVSLSNQKVGKGIAIAGVILSSLAILFFVGMLPE